MALKFITATEAASLVKHGDNIGLSGFTPAGTPKAVTLEIAKIAERLSNVQAIHVEPYNPLAKSKYRQLNRADGGIPEDFPADETIRNYLKTITSYTSKSVELP